jgi:hypothetical protein
MISKRLKRASGWALFVGWILFGSGCTPQKKAESAALTVDAATCRGRLSQIIQSSRTCLEAAADMRYLSENDPACAELFRGRGIALTCGDGK